MNINHAAKLAGTFFTVVGCVTVLTSCGSKRVEGAVCTATNRAIDEEIHAFALNDAEGKIADKSAIQQGARETQNLTRLMIINANLSVLTQNDCPPRTEPISPLNYSAAASDCYGATLEVADAGYGEDKKAKAVAAEKMKNVCDFSRWKEDDAEPR